MSTSTLWDDNFSSYSPGPGHPTGWFDPTGSATIVAFSTMTGSSEAPGFFEQTGQGLFLPGDALYRLDTPSTNSSVQVVWSMWGGFYGNSVPPLTLYNVDLSTYTGSWPGAGNPLCWVTVNNDYTMSINARGTAGGTIGVYPFAITNDQVYFPKVWQMWQLNAEIGSVSVDGTLLVTVNAALALEGEEVCSGFITTNLPLANLYLGNESVNQYQFGLNQNMYLSNFTGIVGSPLPPFGTFPHPGTPDAYYTQSVAEVMKMPDSSVRQGRITQSVNEIIKLPSTTVRQARLTQGVVEIILRPLPGSWQVYEA
jgi:hypothetical protein